MTVLVEVFAWSDCFFFCQQSASLWPICLQWLHALANLPINVWIGRVGTDKESATCTGMSLTFGKVGGIAVDMELHVTGMVVDNGIRVGGTVIKKLNDS